MDLLQYLTPTATSTPEITETPVPSPTVEEPLPPAAPYEPDRSPERAETVSETQAVSSATDKGPIATPTPDPPAAPIEVVSTATPGAVLRPITTQHDITPQPPLNLTPAGVAQGGPASSSSGLPQGTLVTVGALLLAAGGSWGAYYFMKPPAD